MINLLGRTLPLFIALVLGGCQLTVINEGGGIVTSKSGEIHCGELCEANYENYSVNYTEELTAQADEGYVFNGWEGVCTGTEICSIAMQGSTAVTVTASFGEIELSDNKDITEFKFLYGKNVTLSSTITGVIDETSRTILLNVPENANLNALVTTYTNTGKSIAIDDIPQENSLTANDFTNPVIYTVVAEDGSEKNYTVTVKLDPSNANIFTSFRFTVSANPS